MPTITVRSAKVREPLPQTWSNCKVYGEQVFISGMIATDLEGKVSGDTSVYGQAQTIFEKIKNLMEAAGGVMADVIQVTIYVTDITQREEVWRARREFFSSDFPCSTLVEVVALATPENTVEISAIGFLASHQS